MVAAKKKTKVEEEPPVEDVCPWCHNPGNLLHRRSGCKEK